MVIIMLLARSNPEILTAEPESAQAIRETFPRMSLPALMLMMTFVAIWEEVVFRGFLLTRLRALVGRWWLAIFIGAILFSFGHIYQGLLGMFVTFILGLILGALFVWRKSLVPGIVYHICQNVLAFQMTQWLYAGAS
jgi:membrane protease YdiL (CAAX protease family)